MCIMFPLQQGDELFFKISSNPQSELTIPQDQIWGQSTLDCNDITKDIGDSRRRNFHSMDSEEITIDNNKKKKLHREIEKERRKEMSNLYATLRSLLPLEYIKGKRSISDHVNEAVNYIKHLHKKIEELGVKRDELKKLSTSTDLESRRDKSSINFPRSCVQVHQSCGVVEIVISSRFGEEGLPLSRVLELLLQDGLTVISCVSTKVNERLLYTIHIEANDPPFSDLLGLQEKLIQSISPAS
ncbi:HLH domain-containing protein [Cephalotus follicularis]|uniref:HLH domain-containing protein n=1 Tax=Cephalotus follicularis TaxID=3775 RepID=A0A1Q3B1S1_CEPFO|nr:HLH domain-containing protein [Cephalotus follicularis]